MQIMIKNVEILYKLNVWFPNEGKSGKVITVYSSNIYDVFKAYLDFFLWTQKQLQHYSNLYCGPGYSHYEWKLSKVPGL